MKSFRKIYFIVIAFLLLIFSGTNLFLSILEKSTEGKPYRVEINRIAKEIEKNGTENINFSQYSYVTNIKRYNDTSNAFFEDTHSDYYIRQINGKLYRFDYTYLSKKKHQNIAIIVNSALIILSLLILAVMTYLHQKILKPFETLCDVPYELSKGNLTVPIKEQKNHFFGKFIWGINILRENIEQQKQRELALQRDKKTLVLSISHDIKTPLSAIKLYAKSLSKGLYTNKEKQVEIAESINTKADEIESFVSQIIKASNEDFLNLEVILGEFYLSELLNKITIYYNEKLEWIKTAFSIDNYSNCILKGDLNRGIEVVQNVLENAIKYGDGHEIKITFSEEEDCTLLTIKNSGCTLTDTELPHIFESFWRGSNVGSNKGSGLGLYICRQLMLKMDGEIFAEIQGDYMCITVVFRKTS